jgi:hypothetical protein
MYTKLFVLVNEGLRGSVEFLPTGNWNLIFSLIPRFHLMLVLRLTIASYRQALEKCKGAHVATHFGRQAVVIGAGMAGMPAARVLSDYFDQVIVLENDSLPSDAAPRAGTPQSKHAHVLLAGGLQALESLFPGFRQALADAGAQLLRVTLDTLWERPGYESYPMRDLGFTCLNRWFEKSLPPSATSQYVSAAALSS